MSFGYESYLLSEPSLPVSRATELWMNADPLSPVTGVSATRTLL